MCPCKISLSLIVVCVSAQFFLILYRSLCVLANFYYPLSVVCVYSQMFLTLCCGACENFILFHLRCYLLLRGLALCRPLFWLSVSKSSIVLSIHYTHALALNYMFKTIQCSSLTLYLFDVVYDQLQSQCSSLFC